MRQKILLEQANYTYGRCLDGFMECRYWFDSEIVAYDLDSKANGRYLPFLMGFRTDEYI